MHAHSTIAGLSDLKSGSAIHASQRRAGDFGGNESGSQHAEVSAQQIPPVLGQRPEVFPTQVEHSW
jgi:hypothetical protein